MKGIRFSNVAPASQCLAFITFPRATISHFILYDVSFWYKIILMAIVLSNNQVFFTHHCNGKRVKNRFLLCRLVVLFVLTVRQL